MEAPWQVVAYSLLLMLVAGVPLAYSKGSPDLILISGGGLNQPVEITDPALLKAFDPCFY